MENLRIFETEVDYKNASIEYPNVSYTKDSKNVWVIDNPNIIIMTSESNPAVMEICYLQGWAANENYMTKAEAEAVTDIGTAFSNKMNAYGYGYGGDVVSIKTFDEFKYFTNITNIDEYAFNNNSDMISITIPNSVTSIGYDAFASCSSLTSITIPNSVTSIGEYAFYVCNSLTSVTFKEGSQLQTIGSSAFYQCYSLSSITIPNSVTSIGDDAFSGCDSLSSVTFEEGSQLQSIGDSVFRDCSSLSSIIIPNSVTSIGNNAFTYCFSLSSITIPNSVTEIGNKAFWWCYVINFENKSSLDAEANNYWSATIVDERTDDGLCIKNETLVMYIGTDTNLVIPNNITLIGEYVFNFNHTLTSVTIPNTVTEIGAYAFDSEIKEITCLATTAPTVTTYTFYTIPKNGVLKVPSGSDYSSWMSTSLYYLGYHNWTKEEI